MKALALLLASACVLVAQPTFTEIRVETSTMSHAQIKLSAELSALQSTQGTAWIDWSPTSPTLATFQRSNRLISYRTRTERDAFVTGFPADGRKIYVRFKAYDDASVESADASSRCTGPGAGPAGVTLIGLTCDAAGEYPYVVPPIFLPSSLIPIPPQTFDSPVPVVTQDGAHQHYITTASEQAAKFEAAAGAACSTGQNQEIIISLGITFPIGRIGSKTDCAGVKVYVHPDTTLKPMPPDGVRITPDWYTESEWVTWEADANGSRSAISNAPGASGFAFKLGSGCTLTTQICTPCAITGYCSNGWYFRGMRYRNKLSTKTAAVAPVAITGLTYAGTQLTVQVASQIAGGTLTWIWVDTYGTGVQPELRSWFEVVTWTNATTYKINSPGLGAFSGTYGSGPSYTGKTGMALTAQTQGIQSITQPGGAGTDWVVTVPTGGLAAGAGGTYVVLRDYQGLTGLQASPITEATYPTTYVSDTSFSLNGSGALSVTGTHVPGTGHIIYPHLHNLIWIGIPADGNETTFDQILLDGRDTYYAPLYGIYDYGRHTTIKNSYLADLKDLMMLKAAGGWISTVNKDTTAGFDSGFTGSTPCAIFFSQGDGKVYSNNFIESHGISMYSENSGVIGDPLQQPVRNLLVRRNNFNIRKDRVANRQGGGGSGSLFHTRQNFECKQCRFVLVIGNIFAGSNSGEQGNNPAWALTPYSASDLLTALDQNQQGITDVDFQDNLIFRTPVLLVVYANGAGGGTNAGTHHPIITSRIRIMNNALLNMDWTGQRAIPNGTNAATNNTAYNTAVNAGGFIVSSSNPQSIVDYTYTHNTLTGPSANGPSILQANCAGVSGWTQQNNIFEYHNVGSGSTNFLSNGGPCGTPPPIPAPSVAVGGTTFTTDYIGNMWGVQFPYYSAFSHNLIIRGKEDTNAWSSLNDGTVANQINAANANNFLRASTVEANGWKQVIPWKCAGVDQTPSALFGCGATMNDRLNEVGWMRRLDFAATDPSDFTWRDWLDRYNYRMKSDSQFVSGGQKTTDGADMGANIDTIEQSIGHIKNAFLINNATVRALVPDSGEKCYAWAGSAVSDPRPSMTTDTQDKRQRDVAVTAGANPYVFFSCASAPEILRCNVGSTKCAPITD